MKLKLFLKDLFTRAKTAADDTGIADLKARRDADDALIATQRKDGVLTGYIARPDGTTERFLDGELHYDKGPAIERADGTKMWFVKGKLHRDGGPAIEYADGKVEWWKDGQPVPKPPKTEKAEPPVNTLPQEAQDSMKKGLSADVAVTAPLRFRKKLNL